MKAATISQLKKELETCTHSRLVEVALQLTKYKVENKELLSYILFDSDDLATYIADIKLEIDTAFEELKYYSFYHALKRLRKITRLIAKYVKYTGSKEVETELAVYFCDHFISHGYTENRYKSMMGILNSQVKKIERNMHKIHEDLAFDYRIKVKKYNAVLDDY